MTHLRTIAWPLLAAVLLALLPVLPGCGSSSTPGTSPPPVVDLAAANGEYSEGDRIFVWLDALRNPADARPPDVFLQLDNWLQYGNRARYVRIVGDMLVVLATHNDYDGGEIFIWHDYRNIVGNPEPDVRLLNGGYGHVNYMAIHGGDLYVSNRYGNRVLIWRDLATVADFDSPDVMLDNSWMYSAQASVLESANLSDPNAVAVNDHALYVACQGSNQVLVYREPATLQTGDAPDVVLGNPDTEPDPMSSALLTGSQFAGVKHCFLEGNTLFVTCTRRNEGSANGVWAFSPANALVDYQAPDAIIGGPAMNNYPMCVHAGGGRLWVGTRDYTTGLLAYDFPLSYGALPTVELMSETFFGDRSLDAPWTPEQGALTFVPGHVDEFVSIAGGLVGVSRANNAIFGYLDSASVVTDQAPDYILWYPGMEDLRSIDAVLR